MTTPTTGTPRTPGGAIRKVLVDAALTGTTRTGTVELNARVFRRRAPEGATLPYVTFLDPLSNVPALVGDGRTSHRRRLMQVELWQTVADESDELLAALVGVLEDARLEVTGGKMWRLSLDNVVTTADAGDGLVRHVLTCSAAHNVLT